MECNKEEALRAKRIAQNRMQSGDFVGGLKFAMKAKQMFPETQNIAQILAVCEVHCAAQNKVSGSDMDWYGILQTEPLAGEVTIRKQYRKLALLLHPDKNKSPGAEAAFKLIEEANRFLSDQIKCSSYDLRITGPLRTTFWTHCSHCKTRYQYYKTVMNAKLRCQQCAKSFRAYDIAYQDASPGYTRSSSDNHKKPPKHVPPKEASKSNGGKPCGRKPRDRFGRFTPVYMSKRTAGVAKVSAPPEESVLENKMKIARSSLQRKEGSKSDVGDREPKSSKCSPLNSNLHSHARNPPQRDELRTFWTYCPHCKTRYQYCKNVMNAKLRCQQCTKSFRAYDMAYQDASPGYTRSSFDNHKEPPKHVPPKDASKSDGGKPCGRRLRDKFGRFSPVSMSKRTSGVAKVSFPPEESVLENRMKIEQSSLKRKEASKSDVDDREPKSSKCSPLNSNLHPNFEIWYPDPEFSDFEKDRAEDCFAANQFWAIFDDIDSMPRLYALVRKVYSPFKLKITWLDIDSDDQGEIDWHDAGLPVACGKYKLGKSYRTADRAMFSHQIHCIKRSDIGSYLVYPKKGETWAIFRDWDIGWSSNPEKHPEYQFEYVKVRSDFDKNIGIRVSYLGKVKGFVSIFQQTVQDGFRLFCIPPNELYRFSHQIPSYKMAGNEREGVPRGSLELDPAGLPISLFEVGGSGDEKLEDGVLNNGINASIHKSSMSKAEQEMSNEGTRKAKLPESNASGRVSPILLRSPRSNGQASTCQYMSKCTAGVGVSYKVEKSKGGHETAGLTKASVGTSKPGTFKVKESQNPKNVGSKRARQSASDSRDDRTAEIVNDLKDTKVRENGADPSGLDAGIHHRKSSRKKQRVSYTAEGGDSQSSSKRSRQHESFNIAEVGRKEVSANGGLFSNSSPASFTAGVAGQNGEMRNKVSAPPEESLLENKMKNKKSKLQRKAASKSDHDDRTPKADNCSPPNSNLPPNLEICCPDPDFSDFEKDRVEDCFAASQFWAVFDDIDVMPRFYALIRKVYSPFKLQITWLDVDSDDQGEIDWHGAGLPVACGKYKLGPSQITTKHAMFSHQIHCIKGSDRGSYLVYPKKGETWAIFRDWDIGWSSNPGKHSKYQFEYVEVLSDFDENIGIGVSYLGKVKGFVSLFQKTVQNGFRSFCIPPNELYRFSHQIPSYKMTGDEREGVPRGSFELDPAGLPLSLFEVHNSGLTNP